MENKAKKTDAVPSKAIFTERIEDHRISRRREVCPLPTIRGLT